MRGTITEKILKEHLIEGKMEPGEEIAIRIDQTLTQDTTGTLVYLEFEAIGIPRVNTELSVSYVDHNTPQTSVRNSCDHLYLRTIALRYGIYFSAPGNGICHQIHLERFARPGKTLLGSDSHTPTAGGIGSFAIGAGGLDVAAAMAGVPYRLKFPEIVGVKLVGKLRPWVSAKDVALELLSRVGVKGGIGKVFEFFGPGVKTLDVPSRATITNMCVETGATTAIFPSDEVTKAFLEAQGRGEQWIPLVPDENVEYDDVIEIDLGEVEPLVALPPNPDNVKPVAEVAGIEVQQVVIGSCTNSSLRDLKVVANVIKGHTKAPNLELLISPGSRQVLLHLMESGEIRYLIEAGARILEPACGPCIGVLGVPPPNTISVRTINRNFPGRCGTKDAEVYLVSPETAIVTAIKGVLTDPREFGEYPKITLPKRFIVNDSLIIKPLPLERAMKVKVFRGPYIKPLPDFPPLPDRLEGEVLIKVGDNISTDHILPAGAKTMSLRSDIPEISKYVFHYVDPSFYKRALERNGGIIVAGENYGQGSSREHAALAPKYLGVKAVIAKSFARIHRDNLINFGIVPLNFTDHMDYERVEAGDYLVIDLTKLSAGNRILYVENRTKKYRFKVTHNLSKREIEILREGGKLPWIRKIISKTEANNSNL